MVSKKIQAVELSYISRQYLIKEILKLREEVCLTEQVVKMQNKEIDRLNFLLKKLSINYANKITKNRTRR